MNDTEEQEIATLLRRELGRELDRQLGRSGRRFEAHLADQRRWHLRWRAWVALPGAVAACLAAAWLMRELLQIRPTAAPPLAVTETVPADPRQLVGRSVSWRALDEGTVLLDGNVPARQVRRQVLERVQWYDPAQDALYEITVPQEQVIFVKMTTY